MEVKWRSTRNLALEDVRGDLCGEQADTLHLLPYVTECEAVVLACPGHAPVPQGYMDAGQGLV